MNVCPLNLTGNHPLFHPLFWRGNTWHQLRVCRWKEPFVIHVREGAGQSCQRRDCKFVGDKYYNGAPFLWWELMQSCHEFINDFLEVLVPHEERHLKMLWE